MAAPLGEYPFTIKINKEEPSQSNAAPFTIEGHTYVIESATFNSKEKVKGDIAKMLVDLLNSEKESRSEEKLSRLITDKTGALKETVALLVETNRGDFTVLFKLLKAPSRTIGTELASKDQEAEKRSAAAETPPRSKPEPEKGPSLEKKPPVGRIDRPPPESPRGRKHGREGGFDTQEGSVPPRR